MDILKIKAKTIPKHDLQQLLDDMKTFVGILDLEGILVFVNNSPVVAAGIEQQDVIDKYFWDCFWFNYDENVQAIIKNDCESAMLGNSICHEQQVQLKDGLVWIDFSIHPVFDINGEMTHLVPEGRIITERKKMEADLLDREQRFRKYFELGLMGMAITSLEKGWVEFNNTLHIMMGYNREEFAKLTWAELTYPDDLAADIKQFNRVLAGEIEGYSLEKRFSHKDGSIINAIISANAVRKDNGEIDYFVALVHDITALKLTEKQVQDLKKELAKRVIRNNALEDTNKKLTTICEMDFLTKIANRRVYNRRLKECVSSGKREKQFLSLLMIDIDNFKDYNDHYGHDGGDMTLQKVAQAIEVSLPRKTDLAARFGGEEFVVLLPVTDAHGAMQVAEKIRLNIEALNITHEYSDAANVITVSIGVSTLKSDELNEVDLLKNADKFLYIAKNTGRNRCKQSDS